MARERKRPSRLSRKHRQHRRRCNDHRDNHHPEHNLGPAALLKDVRTSDSGLHHASLLREQTRGTELQERHDQERTPSPETCSWSRRTPPAPARGPGMPGQIVSKTTGTDQIGQNRPMAKEASTVPEQIADTSQHHNHETARRCRSRPRWDPRNPAATPPLQRPQPRPEPIPKVSTSTVSVGIPRQSLIDRFWVTARMRMPHTLLFRNHVTPSTATTVITMITRRGTGKGDVHPLDSATHPFRCRDVNVARGGAGDATDL